MDGNNIAIYLDFENLAIAAEQTYPSKENPLLMRPILDYAASLGNICIKKAYADWSKNVARHYEKKLVKYGFEMRHLPGTSYQGKNGADLEMTIDLLEDMQLFPIIDTFIIGSGDTDFIPLIRRVLARGKQVYVIGFENSVSNVIQDNCTEFKSIDELIGFKDESVEDDETEKNPMQNGAGNIEAGRDLLIRYVKNHPSEEPVLLAQLKPLLIRLQPSFSEKQLGFKSFKEFISSMMGDVVKSIEPDPDTGHPRVIFYDLSDIKISKSDLIDKMNHFLLKTLRYQKDPKIRTLLSQILYSYLKENSSATMHEMVDDIAENLPFELSKVVIRKFVFALGEGRAFHYANKECSGSLVNRPQILSSTIQSSDDIERAYYERMRFLMKQRFMDIEDEMLDSLLN